MKSEKENILEKYDIHSSKTLVKIITGFKVIKLLLFCFQIKFNFESKELPASYNGFSKYSNKEVVHKHKYCYKDQCDKVEAVSKVKSSGKFAHYF